MADTTETKNTSAKDDLMTALDAVAQDEKDRLAKIDGQLDVLQERQDRGASVEAGLSALAKKAGDVKTDVDKGVDWLARIDNAMTRMENRPRTAATPEAPSPEAPDNPDIVGAFGAAPVQGEISLPADLSSASFVTPLSPLPFNGIATTSIIGPGMDSALRAWAEEEAREEEARLKKKTMIFDDGPAVEAPKKVEEPKKNSAVDPNAADEAIDETKLAKSKFATNVATIDLKGKHFQKFYDTWGVPMLDAALVKAIEAATIKDNSRTGGFTIVMESGHKIDWIPNQRNSAGEFIGLVGRRHTMDEQDAEVIIAAAKSKGMDSVNVHGGTKEREMLWLEAMRQGLKVKNFQPAIDSDVRKAWEAEENEIKAGVINADPAAAAEGKNPEAPAKDAAAPKAAAPAPVAAEEKGEEAPVVEAKGTAKPAALTITAPKASKFAGPVKTEDHVGDRLKKLAEHAVKPEERQEILAARDAYLAGKLKVEQSTVQKMSAPQEEQKKIDAGYDELRAQAGTQGVKLPDLQSIRESEIAAKVEAVAQSVATENKAAAVDPILPAGSAGITTPNVATLTAFAKGEGPASVGVDELIKRSSQRQAAAATAQGPDIDMINALVEGPKKPDTTIDDLAKRATEHQDGKKREGAPAVATVGGPAQPKPR